MAVNAREERWVVGIASNLREVTLPAENGTTQSSLQVRETQNGMIDGLFGTGIDDLAKYRIVQYLQECSHPLDVCSISASLGLHPIELVMEALESLACSGILVREGEDPPVYTITCRPTLRGVLDKLYRPASPQERECVLRTLAASSLAKARARARLGGGEGKR